MKDKGYYKVTYPRKETYTDNNGNNEFTKIYYTPKQLCKAYNIF